jgi:hypothetical protein
MAMWLWRGSSRCEPSTRAAARRSEDLLLVDEEHRPGCRRSVRSSGGRQGHPCLAAIGGRNPTPDVDVRRAHRHHLPPWPLRASVRVTRVPPRCGARRSGPERPAAAVHPVGRSPGRSGPSEPARPRPRGPHGDDRALDALPAGASRHADPRRPDEPPQDRRRRCRRGPLAGQRPPHGRGRSRTRRAGHQGRLRRRADDGIRTRDLHLGKGLEGVQQGPTASTAIRPKPLLTTPLTRGNVHPRRSRSSADPGRRRVVRYSCVTHSGYLRERTVDNRNCYFSLLRRLACVPCRRRLHGASPNVVAARGPDGAQGAVPSRLGPTDPGATDPRRLASRPRTCRRRHAPFLRRRGLRARRPSAPARAGPRHGTPCELSPSRDSAPRTPPDQRSRCVATDRSAPSGAPPPPAARTASTATPRAASPPQGS